MVKARVGSASAAAAIGIRAWFHPSFLMFGSVQYNYAGWDGTSGGSYGAAPSWTRVGDLPLRWGLVLQIENFGAIRYERGSQVGGQSKRYPVLSFGVLWSPPTPLQYAYGLCSIRVHRQGCCRRC